MWWEHLIGIVLFAAFVYFAVTQITKKKSDRPADPLPVVTPRPTPTPVPPVAPVTTPVPSPVPQPVPAPSDNSLRASYPSLLELLAFIERTGYGGKISVDGDEVNPGYGPEARFEKQGDGSLLR